MKALTILFLALILALPASAQPRKHKVRHVFARIAVVTLEVVTAPVVYPIVFLMDIGGAD